MRIFNLHVYISTLLLISLVSACSSCSSHSANPSNTEHQVYSTDSLTEGRIKAQRTFLRQERAEIDSFIKNKNWSMERTGTGLYIQNFPSIPSARTPAYGDYVTVAYSSFLLDGSALYSSDSTGALKWRIEKDDSVPIGLHEAVLKMNEGDSSRVILPSHLAYGIGGDQLKVPLKAAVLFKLRLISFSTP
jgi:FKBP-type peptidyl-prolyl cis-trans isomerase FkpA